MDNKSYVKRLQTVQNMTETAGVKEVCEILMDYFEAKEKKELGFKAEEK